MSAVKALQQWCRVRCDGYRDVSITNMTTSFRDGLAFCALIHKHRPELINFDALKKEDVYENNKLAFKVAEEQLGIPALLDAEDMVALKVPDRLSILTYVSQYYNYFHGRSPIGGMGAIKRPADGPADEPSGKKNQPVAAKAFPSSKPARENSPPPSSNITRPSPSPRQTGRETKETKDVVVERSLQGTLSNKCVSCSKHVHLVQRHLVDGKLYHRSCAKTLSPTNPTPPFQKENTPVSRLSPLADSTKTNTASPPHAPSRLGPSWLTEKASTPLSFSITSSSSLSPAAAPKTQTHVASKPPASWTPRDPPAASWTPRDPPAASRTPCDPPAASRTPCDPPAASRTPRDPPAASWTPRDPPAASRTPCDPPAASRTPRDPPAASWTPRDPPAASRTPCDPPAASRTPRDPPAAPAATSISAGPTAAPRASTTAAKTLQSKLRFLQSESGEEKKATTTTTTTKVVVTKGPDVGAKAQEAAAGQAVTVLVKVGGFGRKEADESPNAGGGGAKASAGGGESKTKASAAAFISKKLSEESNNNNNVTKPAWATVALKKTDKPAQVETPKREPQGVRGRKVLRADPALLADLSTPADPRTPSPARGTGLRARTPDRGASQPAGASPNTSALENKASPLDWRSKLKPISQPAGPSQSSPKPWANGAAKPQTSEPSPSSRLPSPSISVTPPAAKGILNDQKDPTANGTKSESKKMKPDYILKEDIIRELQEIEDDLNEWEKRGVELEVKLRSSEEEGEDDSLMDEVMVEWFNLIRNKQVAMRRESELVYIGKTQDLEEEQPTVEQELRRLMEKPERLKTRWDRKREEELMAKLVEIVNDRNAIIEGLDEDRLREDEEDEELNKMMMTFNVKKDKPKKKSPMSKLFGLGKKKEG